MRVFHTADWHLGQELYRFDRTHEHQGFLDWLAARLCEEKADGLVVAGDVFDTSNPPVGAQAMFFRFLARVLDDCPALQVVIVGGNHDSAARIELPAPLLDARRVALVGSMPRRDGAVNPAGVVRVLSDADGKPAVVCAAVPYLRPGDIPPTEDGADPVRALYARVVAAARDEARDAAQPLGASAGPPLPLLVTGHLNVAGSMISQLSERRIMVGGEEAVAVDIFPDDVAYVALGHLHRPQVVGQPDRVRYAGSPLPLAVDEATYDHGVTVIDFDTTGVRDLRTLAVPRAVEFLRVPRSGGDTLDDVLADLGALPDDDPGEDRRPFLDIRVRIDGPVPDLRARIEAALAEKPYRITRIERVVPVPAGGAAAGGAETGRRADTLENWSPKDLFRLCHRQRYGADPAAELEAAFDELLSIVQAGQEENA